MSVLQQAKSALRQMGTSFQKLAALAGRDSEGTGKALKKAQATLNNMAKKAGEHTSATGALVAHSRAGDAYKLAEKSTVAKQEAEELASRIGALVTDLDTVAGAFRAAEKAANDTANAI